jgi:RND family efflux transporter MFP subunit
MRVLPILSLSLLTLAITSCGDAKPQAPAGQMPLTPVGVASPIARTIPVVRDLTGRLEAVESVEVRPRVSGQVIETKVRDGVEVTAGQVLFVIDPEPIKATIAKLEADIVRNNSEVERATAEIARAEALLAQSSSTRDRNLKLVGDKIISQQQYDDSVAAVNTTKAGLEAATSAKASAIAALVAARAALVSAQLDLEHTNVTAPISGRIGRIATTVGNQVQGGSAAQATLMTTLVKHDPIYAVFDVDDTTWHSIGARLRASAAGGEAVPVHVALPGETGYPHTGSVTFADNQIDSASGAIRVRATLPNADGVLTPGSFARIELEVAKPRDVLLVHERAVLAQLATRYVLAVDDKGVTSFRPVTLGDRVGQMRVVEQGLGPADRIAVNNLAKIFFPGMPVQPMPASMETLVNDAAPAAPAVAAKPAAEGTKQ